MNGSQANSRVTHQPIEIQAPRRISGFQGLCLTLTIAAGSGCNKASTTPTDLNCGKGPITTPVLGSLKPCETVTPMCPASRPDGARTLVGLSVCDYPVATTPPPPSACRVSICPVLPPEGSQVGFVIGPNDTSACVSSLLIHLTPEPSGGITYGWTLDEKETRFDAGGCNIIQSTKGSGSVPGPCCSAEAEIPAVNIGRTIRINLQADWAR